MQLSQIPVQTPTPFYYYNLELLKKTVQAAKSESAPYGYRVHYAVKANANPVLLRLISQQGLGADSAEMKSGRHWNAASRPIPLYMPVSAKAMQR